MRRHPAVWVVVAGVTAALHVGKLPPALPVLRDSLGVTLLQAGFLLSLVQLAGMTLGLALGLLADGFGLRRSMVTGLVILASASAWGATATSASALLVLRAVEGLGFLLTVLSGPSLIRHLVATERLSKMMGWWGSYMPLGAALALALGPLVMAVAGWRGLWCLLALVSASAGWALWWHVPDDRQPASAGRAPAGWRPRLALTLGSRGPWLLAASFAMYSGQWLAVVGFLPTVYADAGVAAGLAGALTALVAAVNMLGNVASGRLLQRGVAAQQLLYGGFCVMGFLSIPAFVPLGLGAASPWVSFLCVALFSAVGGLVPGTLFALSVRVAPSPGTVSTTVGWMQQLSALGQLCGPPGAAWVASQVGNWQSTWWVTLGCSLAGIVLARAIAAMLRRPAGGP